MKKKNFLIRVWSVLALVVAMTSCGKDDDIPSPYVPPVKLATPANVKFDQVERLLTWDKVGNAAAYRVQKGGMLDVSVVKTNSYKLSDTEVDKWLTYSIGAVAPENSKQWENSEFVSFRFVCPVKKQLLAAPNSKLFSYKELSEVDGKVNVKIVWGAVEHAASYQFYIRLHEEGEISGNSKTVLKNETESQVYRGKTYMVSVYAKPSIKDEAKYINSDKTVVPLTLK